MKRFFNKMGLLVAMVAMTGLLLGCGSEDPEVVASTLCDSIDACEDQSATAECPGILTEGLQELQDDDGDCYDAIADAVMCGGGQCGDDVGDECSDEDDAVDENCTAEQVLGIFFADFGDDDDE